MSQSERIPAEVIEGYREVAVTSICDALDQIGATGYMTCEIKPIFPAKIVGPAVTVKEVPCEESVPPTHALEAIDRAEPGSVIVIDVGAVRDVAVWGGLMTAGAVVRELEGAVLDGGVRDTDEIREDYGFPVFARSVSPATTVGRYKTEAYNIPVVCGGVTVNPGDLIVGDSDGVVVVPPDKAEVVLEMARGMEETERKQVELIKEVKSIVKAIERFRRI